MLVAILSTAIPLRAFSQHAAELQETIGFLIIDLNSKDLAARDEATAKLYRIGEAAVGALQKALTSQNVETRLRARSILASLGKIELLRRSLKLPAIVTGVPRGIHGDFKSVHIERVGGAVQLTTAGLDAEELTIDSVDDRAWLTLAGRIKTVHIGTLDGRCYVDASSLTADRIEIGVFKSGAVLTVRSLDHVEFLAPLDSTSLERRSDSVTVSRVPLAYLYVYDIVQDFLGSLRKLRATETYLLE
jgi:hypothetical protein